jgi:thymidylate synthase
MTYFPTVWLDGLSRLIALGDTVNPRAQETLELLHQTFCVDMSRPVLTVPERKLSYQFMAAEAYWILTGDDRVRTIAPYNKNIAHFSDDGETFFGAYGPKIIEQLPYVIQKLVEDPSTRQAGLTIWRESPPRTKDVPCTIAVFFNLRSGILNCSTFMRSSDIWLGLPYDVFNFSMLTHYVCAKLNDRVGTGDVVPGILRVTAASSHLYERNMEAASECLASIDIDRISTQREVPGALYSCPDLLLSTLKHLRESKPGDELRWWES